MGHHLTESGRFKSDKYPDLPPDKIILSFTDPLAWEPLLMYAASTPDLDLGADILAAVTKATSEHPDTQHCHKCGCYEQNACHDGTLGNYIGEGPHTATCTWVEPDLCSGCSPNPFLVDEEGFLLPFPEGGTHGPSDQVQLWREWREAHA